MRCRRRWLATRGDGRSRRDARRRVRRSARSSACCPPRLYVIPGLSTRSGGSVTWRWCEAERRPMKLKLDLHDIYDRGRDIDRALAEIIDEAVRIKAPMIEIIPGKGSGQLKKRVLRFLERKDIKPLYHRIEKNSKNFGRLFIHFLWK